MNNTNTDIWIAGAVAAVIVDVFVYPVDTLKTRIQSPDYEKIYKHHATGAIRRNILFKGLYHGVWSVVFATIPASGAFFTTYEAVKWTLRNASSHSGNPDLNRLPFTHSLPSPVMHGIASSSAEMVACLMLTPAEVLKQNAQIVRGGHKPANTKATNNTPTKGGSHKEGATSTTTTTTTPTASNRFKASPTMRVLSRFRNQPWKLWSGYTALVGRNLPFTGLQFPIFEYVRGHVVEWRRRKKESASSAAAASSGQESILHRILERATLTGMSASVSGTIASIVTTPIDVIKTRVMLSAPESTNTNGLPTGSNNHEVGDGKETAGKKKSKQRKKPKMKGTLAVGRQIFRDEGIRGLFKGGAIRAGWSAVSLSMYLSIYEGARFYLENKRNEKDMPSSQRASRESQWEKEGATI